MRIGFDIDGTLTNFEKFVLDNAITYMKKKYDMDVVNKNGYDIDQVFDVENQLLKRGYSNEEATIKTKQIMNGFWEGYYPKYILAPFRDGVAETLNKLYEEGNEIFIISSRKKATENSIKGRIVRSSIDLQFALNKVKHNHILLFENDEEKLKAIEANYIDIMVDDKPELISKIAKFTDVVCIDSAYNTNHELGINVKRATGYENDQVYNIINSIIAENKRKISDGSTVTGVPSVDKLWLKNYSKGDMKWSLNKMSPYERMTVTNMSYPKYKVVSYFKKALTQKEFMYKVDSCAKMLASKGIGKEDIVPLLVVNTPETVVMIAALLKLQATIVPISPEETAISIENKLKGLSNDKKIKALYLVNYFNKKEGQFLSDKIEPIRNKLGIETAICSTVGDSMPFGYKVLYNLSNGNRRAVLNEHYTSFNQYIEAGSKIKEDLDIKYNDIYTAAIIYTGGTIESKGVKITSDNIDAEIRHFLNTKIGIKRDEKISGILPFDHIYGLLINLIVPISKGMEVVLRPKPERKKLDQLLVGERVNYFATIPVLLNEILKNPKMTKADLSNVKQIFSGAEAISDTLMKQLTDFFAERNSEIKTIDGYGSSELTAMCLENGIPIIDTIVKVVETGTEQELGYDQTGELCINGPTVMEGYYNNEEKTGKALRVHADGKTWLHTGDLASIDLDGRVTIRGRIEQDIIKVNGQMVNLFAINKIIEKNSMVQKSVVLKYPNEQKGHIPVAFVEVVDGLDDEAVRYNIINSCSKYLTYYENPESFVFVDDIPLTSRGKIDRKVLLDFYDDKITNSIGTKQKVLTYKRKI